MEPKEISFQDSVRYVVGIGASAGGLEALETFFEKMPIDSGLAFVVVQHLSPDYESMMDALLARKTTMPVIQVKAGETIEANTIYLIPPKKNMTVYGDKLLLTEQEREHTLNLPIDIFLRSLATDRKESAIGIILSGTGSDGTSGIRAIKEHGGMVMVQEPESAKFDGMPASAIATGLVDYVLLPENMPQELIKFIDHPIENLTTENDEGSDLKTKIFTKIFGLLQKDSGVDFSCYKTNTVYRRIERRMRINQLWDLSDYVNLLSESHRELSQLYKELFIGVTNFFRDPDVWKLLEQEVIPKVVEESKDEDEIRIWCPGCSTGEEAYSIAILLQEEMQRQNLRREVKIFATDLDQDAMEVAMVGTYPESVAADISSDRIANFFTPKGQKYQINRQLREMVIFARHNLLRDPPFTRIDFISCRNLLIYVKPAVQKKVFSFFEFSLRKGGFLLLGSSETIGESMVHFETINAKARIYRSLIGPNISSRTPAPGPSQKTKKLAMDFSKNPLSFSERRVEPLYQKVLDTYAPPGMVVNERFEITHIFRDISAFVTFPVGKLSTRVTDIIIGSLRTPLNTALHKAQKSDTHLSYRNIQLEKEGKHLSVDLIVSPYEDRLTQNRFYLIFFENFTEALEAEDENREIVDANSASGDLVKDLERELEATRENLQAMIEELETSNEELQATNEELVSSNEELQSTNEELQSLNEELYTVNSEYQTKIQELVELNSDIDNLMLSLDVATIFLDSKMCIRKFSEPAAQVFNIRSQDIGRPLNHLTHRLNYKTEIMDDIRCAIGEKTILRKEVQTASGEWMLMMIAPYADGRGGHRQDAVLSFVDISTLKQAQQEAKESEETLRQSFDLTRSIWLECDATGKIAHVSPNAEKLLHQKHGVVEGHHMDDLFSAVKKEDGTPIHFSPFEHIRDKKNAVDFGALTFQLASGRELYANLSTLPMMDKTGNLHSVMINIHRLDK